MKAAAKRALVGLATLATALGVAVSPASAADNGYTPSATDFSACPAKPANATGTWTCYAMTAVGGYVRLDKMWANITTPWRLTIAQGNVNGVKTAILGGLSADPIPFVTGVEGTPVAVPSPTGWSLRPVATGQVTPGAFFPSKLGVKIEITGGNIAGACTIGSAASPVTFQPRVQWFVPWLFGSTLAVKSLVYDDVFSLPSASGCDQSFSVNQLIGLPANATSNHIQIDWAYRTKTI